MASFAELRAAGRLFTAPAFLEAQLSLLAERDFPVTSWIEGEPAYDTHDAIAECFGHMSFRIEEIADGATVHTAITTEQQDRAGWSQYREARKEATFTAGKMVLLNGGGVSQNISPGALFRTIEGRPATYRYVGVVPAAVPAGGSKEIDVVATERGSAANIQPHAPLALMTAIAGISVTNPPIATSQTWITSLGADRETLGQYDERMSKKWATLSTGSPLPAYEFWAEGVVGVTRSHADGAIGYGQINLYIDNAALVGAVQNLVQPTPGTGKAPFGSRVTVVAATVENVPLPSVVYVRRQFRAEVEARVVVAMAALSARTKIGGLLVKSEIIRLIKGALEINSTEQAVTDFQFNDSQWIGGPNYQLPANKIPLLSTNLIQYVET